MSEPRVAALVCEGQSDVPILRAILEKLWPGIEVRTLQPLLDATGKNATGAQAGWTAVRSWCAQNDLREIDDPLVGSRPDVLIVAIDVDIALEAGVVQRPTAARAYDARALCRAVRSWLSTPIPPSIIIALPAMAIETWVIAARYTNEKHPENIANPAQYLVDKGLLWSSPTDSKPMKYLPVYTRDFGPAVAQRLKRVRKACGEAERTCKKIEQRRAAVEAGAR